MDAPRPITRLGRGFLCGLVVAVAVADRACAADFRSVGEGGATLYDAPSAKARPLFVATRGLPVEVISTDGSWVKVRDPSGDLAWIDGKGLSRRRTVLALVRVLDVRERPDEQSSVVLQIGEGVLLDLVEPSESHPGWLQVRHRDGAAGFVRVGQVWGG
jgi:SH3-like domain-containing protein